MQKVYFKNLNGLRFLASFIVITEHLLQVRKDLGWDIFTLPKLWITQNELFGKLGVVLFFVLSGFLITYLLLIEEKETKIISIKDFYLRRIFRIWPLYFFLVFLSFFVLRNIPFFQIFDDFDSLYSFKILVLYLMILPNLVLMGMRCVVPYISQTWSIGVEEQFYIIWPILMKYVKNKIYLLIGIIIVYLVIKFLILPIILHYYVNTYLVYFSSMWDYFYIDCMAIGGLFAVISFKKMKILKILYNPILNIIVVFLLCISLYHYFHIEFIYIEIHAILFGILILNLATNPKPLFNLENRVLNYLGKISYGLYMYHILALVITLKSLRYVGIENVWLQFTFSVIVTIGIASISYTFFEKRFIKLKAKYSKIISGDLATK